MSSHVDVGDAPCHFLHDGKFTVKYNMKYSSFIVVHIIIAATGRAAEKQSQLF